MLKLAIMSTPTPRPPLQILQQAETIITALKAKHTANRLQFDMECSIYLAGRPNLLIRQAVIYAITNAMPTATNATLTHVSTLLTGHYQQTNLFA